MSLHLFWRENKRYFGKAFNEGHVEPFLIKKKKKIKKQAVYIFKDYKIYGKPKPWDSKQSHLFQ